MPLPILKALLSAAAVIAPIGISLYERKSRKSTFISDRLYCGYMNNEFTEQEIKDLCKEYGIAYPPKPSMKGLP